MEKNNKQKRDKKFVDIFLADLKKEADQVELPQGFHDRFQQRFESATATPAALISSRLMKPVMLACGVGALLMLGVAFWIVMPKEQPRIQVMQGNPTLSTKHSDHVPLQKNHIFHRNDRITTGPADWVVLELDGHYRIKVQPNSSFTIQGLKPKFMPGLSLFYVSRGEALIDIGGKVHKNYPLEVQTSNAYGRAMGTQFMVRAPAPLQTQSWIGVISGKVHAGQIIQGKRFRPSQIEIPSGQEVYISEDAPAISARHMVQKQILKYQELFSFGELNRIMLLIPFDQTRVYALLKPCKVYLRVENEDEQMNRVKAAIAQMGRALKADAPRQHQRAAKAFETSILNQNKLDKVSGLLFAGAYYNYVNLPAEAVRTWEYIVTHYPDSIFHSLAMLAAAIVYHEELKEDEKALSLVRELLQKHPESLESAEATALRDNLTSAK